MILAQLNLARLRNCLLLIVLLALLALSNQSAAFSADGKTSLLRPALKQDQDDDVVRVNTELVILNATVLDKDGKFVSGLRRADFRVFEDGQEQKLTSFTAEETAFAAAILLDTSGSMESRLTLGRSAAIRFLDGLRDEDVAAVYKR